MIINKQASLISRAALFSLVVIGGPTTFMGLTTYALSVADGAFFGESPGTQMNPNKAI